MSEKSLHLEIITPEKILISEDVDGFEAPGVDGEFQILANHTPFLTSLRVGHVIIDKTGSKTIVPISGGFCEIKESKAVILAHTAEKINNIDKKRAEAARARAEKRIEESKSNSEIDQERAKLALLRALNRLNALENA